MTCFRNWISYVGRHLSRLIMRPEIRLSKVFTRISVFKRDAIIHISILQYVLFSSPGPLSYRICIQLVLRIQVHVVLDSC